MRAAEVAGPLRAQLELRIIQPLGQVTITCPRCFFTAPAAPGMRFCPRCGLADVQEAASDTSPMPIAGARHTYDVFDRLAVGSICNVYRCRFKDGRRQVEGIFKIARDARANHLVVNEAETLQRLQSLDAEGRFRPFLPAIEESLDVGDGSSASRRANILRMHEEIGSPDELYTLGEVKGAYPAGLDGRDMAWIWRRLLNILGFVHASEVIHGAVLPMHVLIEPRDHKLLLIDWCCAAQPPRGVALPKVVSGGYQAWYKREGAGRQPPTPGLDIGLGARCMIELLGGDPVRAQFPAAVDPALQRYFERCVGGNSGPRPDAWKLLNEFDQLIEVLWGPRRFRLLAMPARQCS